MAGCVSLSCTAHSSRSIVTGRAMGPNHALQRAAHEEILLLQAQDFTLRQLVV
jgi:hypothetical protein